MSIRIKCKESAVRIQLGSFRDCQRTKLRSDDVLVFTAAGAYRNISHGPASCPISLAVLAEMSRLIHIVVVEIAEFCIHAIAAWAWEYFVRFLESFVM